MFPDNKVDTMPLQEELRVDMSAIVNRQKLIKIIDQSEFGAYYSDNLIKAEA